MGRCQNHERDWTGSNDAFTQTLPAVPATATSGPNCNGTQVCDSRGECGASNPFKPFHGCFVPSLPVAIALCYGDLGRSGT